MPCGLPEMELKGLGLGYFIANIKGRCGCLLLYFNYEVSPLVCDETVVIFAVLLEHNQFICISVLGRFLAWLRVSVALPYSCLENSF